MLTVPVLPICAAWDFTVTRAGNRQYPIGSMEGTVLHGQPERTTWAASGHHYIIFWFVAHISSSYTSFANRERKYRAVDRKCTSFSRGPSSRAVVVLNHGLWTLKSDSSCPTKDKICSRGLKQSCPRPEHHSLLCCTSHPLPR